MPTILACLPDRLFEVAQRAIPGLVRVGSLAEARSLLRTSHVDGLICDPATEAVAGAPELFWLAADFPSLRITLYTVLDPLVAQALVRLAGAGITDVVLFGYEDSAERWDEVVTRSAVSETVRHALAAVAPALANVDAPLRYALQDAFNAPRKFRTVDELATAAATNRRGVYRKLHRARIQAVREWLDWARLVNAYALQHDPGRSIDEIAQLVGYANRADLAAHLRTASGYTLGELNASVTISEFVARMAERLLLPPLPAGTAAGSATADVRGHEAGKGRRHA